MTALTAFRGKYFVLSLLLTLFITSCAHYNDSVTEMEIPAHINAKTIPTFLVPEPIAPEVIVFENGDRYAGDVENGIPNGVGKYRYGDDSPFSGTVIVAGFIDGVAEGEGRIVTPHSVYTGSIKHGVPDGMGTSVSALSRYDGQFVNGVMHGYGRMDYAEGRYFEGLYENGYAKSGTFYLPELGTFKGEIKAGKLFGTITYLDGTTEAVQNIRID